MPIYSYARSAQRAKCIKVYFMARARFALVKTFLSRIFVGAEYSSINTTLQLPSCYPSTVVIIIYCTRILFRIYDSVRASILAQFLTFLFFNLLREMSNISYLFFHVVNYLKTIIIIYYFRKITRNIFCNVGTPSFHRIIFFQCLFVFECCFFSCACLRTFNYVLFYCASFRSRLISSNLNSMCNFVYSFELLMEIIPSESCCFFGISRRPRQRGWLAARFIDVNDEASSTTRLRACERFLISFRERERNEHYAGYFANLFSTEANSTHEKKERERRRACELSCGGSDQITHALINVLAYN
ncbi:uncharacterized protein [Venturia canescens]|uniref:uncharacterized protein n=1 Tax=Venturia canescens TaxID=32260 RepID=UPI001C9C70A9|nr:uncharacterized protein LOC122408117 [Venturia canescens]